MRSPFKSELVGATSPAKFGVTLYNIRFPLSPNSAAEGDVLLRPTDLLLLALFLFPIAVYCTILGLINRRPRPLMVSGAWDFLGMLLATSGFLVVVGPGLLSGAFRESMKELPIERESLSLGNAIAEIWAAWWVLWLLYYLLVLGGAAFLLWMRRDTIVIYNIDLTTLESALARAAERLGLEIHRRGNQLQLTAVPSNERNSHATDGEMATALTTHPNPSAPPWAILEVDPFPFLSNVALHWRTHAPLPQAEFGRELRKSLSEVLSPENSAGAWMLGIATFLFVLIMMLTGAYIVLVLAILQRR